MSLRSRRDQVAREDEWFEETHPEVVARERAAAAEVRRRMDEEIRRRRK